MQTNHNPSVEWVDRTEPTNFTYGIDTGVDYETIAELANVTGKDLWINVPYGASDDYVRRMARLFRDRVLPSIKIYVEHSNEIWNPIFQQMRDNQAASKIDPTLTKQDDFGRQAQLVGKQIVRISNLFRLEFGEARFGSQVRPILGGLIAADYWASTALQYIQDYYGPPSRYLHAIAIAPYVGVPGDMLDIDNENLTLDSLFPWMHWWINNRVLPWIMQHKAIADRYGLKLHSYEGGQHLQAIDGTNEQLKLDAQNDPRMGAVYQHLIQMWHLFSGGGIFGNFALASPSSRWGNWGLLTAIDQAGSVKWDAVMSTIGPNKYPG
jgi:hypothetical protein